MVYLPNILLSKVTAKIKGTLSCVSYLVSLKGRSEITRASRCSVLIQDPDDLTCLLGRFGIILAHLTHCTIVPKPSLSCYQALAPFIQTSGALIYSLNFLLLQSVAQKDTFLSSLFSKFLMRITSILNVPCPFALGPQ